MYVCIYIHTYMNTTSTDTHLELRYYFEICPNRKVIARMFLTGDDSSYIGVGWPPGGGSQ
jgi:hypothetical protein